MTHRLAVLGAIGALSLQPSDLRAASVAEDRLASVRYLVGKWNCAHTVGTFAGTYTTTYESVLGNRWLKQTYDFAPAQAEPAKRAEAFIGYDEGRKTWVRFFAMSTGEYFANRMAETDGGGWSWKYISFFKTTRPESAGADATFTKRSESEYTIEGPSYPENGTIVTEHHVCRKP